MELLYVWINKSENNVFSKQDVLLTDQYSIKTTFVETVEDATIEISENIDYYNIFQNDVISNITGIVGSNGAGKTTLLNYLFTNDVEQMATNDNLAFKIHYQNLNSINKTIQIFSENNKILVFHNLTNVVINSKLDCEKFEMKYMKDIRFLDGSYGRTLTKIYLTNGNYYPDTSALFESIGTNKITLTINSLKTLANSFYKKNVTAGQVDYNFNLLQEMIVQTKVVEDFQCICDVIYANKLIEMDIIESFLGKMPTSLEIYSLLLPDILKSVVPSIIDENLKSKIIQWNDLCIKLKKQDFKLIDFLKLNLIFEIDYCLESLNEINDFTGKNGVTIIDFIYEKMIHRVEKLETKTVRKYFVNAAEEIKNLECILSDIDTDLDIHKYLTDPKIYQRVTKISRENKYDEFVKYVSDLAKKKSFFTLKYLCIKGISLSSGERAFLNFFSWLNLMSFFNQISSNFIKETNENILLLIDEIDLYCHPEWQRQFIAMLIDELKNQFSDKKIQIIFTTHSPILLSDIPNSNIIFLKNNVDSSLTFVKNRKDQTETFMQNIITLFDDVFFLESSLGVWANRKIHFLKESLERFEENKLYNEIDIENIKTCKKIVNMIGDPVLRNFYTSKIKKIDADFQSQKLQAVIADFEQLDKSEQANLIQYIIKTKGVHNK